MDDGNLFPCLLLAIAKPFDQGLGRADVEATGRVDHDVVFAGGSSDGLGVIEVLEQNRSDPKLRELVGLVLSSDQC